jgi:hypothetical protein
LGSQYSPRTHSEGDVKSCVKACTKQGGVSLVSPYI